MNAPFTVYDSFRNLLAGFGVLGRDKAASQRFVLNLLDPEQLTAAYRSDWVSRKICDVPPFDACRAWREWQAEKEQIEKLEECEADLGIQRKLMWAMAKARLFGGAALVLGIEGQKLEDELDPDTVEEGSLKFVHAVTRWNLQAGPLMRDLTSPWFGEPTYYLRSNAPTPQEGTVKPVEASGLGYKEGEQIWIHPSRVVRLIGLDYPDWEMAPDQWGDSCLQPVVEAIQNAGLVSSSIAAMISEAKLDVIKIPGLMEMLGTTEGTKKVFERFSQANAAKSVVNATLVDTAEEWERIQLSFSGMDGIMSMYLMIAAGAADIPATRLLGRSPEGMNATGDSDMRNYYDRLQADQKTRLQPAMTRLDEVLIRHALGDRPDEIYYEWRPLWQLDEDQKSTIALRKAQAHKIDVDNGLLNPDVLREARQNQVIEDGFYPGIEAAIDEFGSEPEEDPHEEMDLQMKQAELQQMTAPAAMNGGRPPRAWGDVGWTPEAREAAARNRQAKAKQVEARADKRAQEKAEARAKAGGRLLKSIKGDPFLGRYASSEADYGGDPLERRADGSVMVGVRDIGEWVNPEHARNDEDYDWQVPTPETKAAVKAFVAKFEKEHGVKIDLDGGEKNWTYFTIR